MSATYRALWVEEGPAGQFTRRLIERDVADLPDQGVLVRVAYSSLNYKDALSASGNKGVTRRYPHQPGIDAAGTVERSSGPVIQSGDQVLVVGTEIGASLPGGFGQYLSARPDWLTRIPPGLSARESMILGTAGFTAALMVDKLMTYGVIAGDGEVLVTGATGGVGTLAVAILGRLGYEVVAATGKLEQAELLRLLGAKTVLHRDEVNDTSEKPLLTGRWAGVVDTVGGSILASAIRSTRPGGVVTACGNAASAELRLTVYPFILRGVSLVGVDALRPTPAQREMIWSRLAGEWKPPLLDRLAREVTLEALEREIELMLRGGQIGRVIVNLERR